MAFHILTVLKIRTTEKVVFFQCTETKWCSKIESKIMKTGISEFLEQIHIIP